MLLLEEYARGNAHAYKYTSFCFKYRLFAQSLKCSMRQSHAAGEKMFVDYAGQTAPIIDPASLNTALTQSKATAPARV